MKREVRNRRRLSRVKTHIGQIVTVIVVFCLAVGLIVVKLYRDLASLRAQLDTARAQINAQIAHRANLLKALQSAIRIRESESKVSMLGPSLVGQDIHSLLADLKVAEDKITFARDYYNETVKTYDGRLREFPYSLVASSLGIRPRELLDLNLTYDA